MPSLMQPRLVFTAVTVASFNLATVSSTTGVHRGHVGYFVNGGVSARVKVTNVSSATTLRIQYDPKIDDANFDRKSGTTAANDSGLGGQSFGGDLSGLSGGTLTFPAQLVAVAADYSKLPSPI